MSAYENRIAKLECEKLLAEERRAETVVTRHTLEESLERAMTGLSKRRKIWKNADLGRKRTVFRLTFIEPLPHSRNERDFEHQI